MRTLLVAGVFTGACLLLTGCGKALTTTGGGVVSMAPHITETVFALGQGARLVGRGHFDDYPEVEKIEDVGGYLDPKLERIALLKPEMILLPGEHRKVAEFAAMNHIQTVSVNMDSFATIDAGITKLGEVLHCEDKAAALNAKIKGEMDALRAKVAGAKRPSVLIITERDTHDLKTLYTAGDKSFVSQMVDLAGGDNIFAKEAQPYFEASKERVVAAAPQVILEFHAGSTFTENQKQQFQDDWSAMREIPAVTTYRVYLILESYALRPGPRVAEMAQRIAKLLHPDIEWGA